MVFACPAVRKEERRRKKKNVYLRKWLRIVTNGTHNEKFNANKFVRLSNGEATCRLY